MKELSKPINGWYYFTVKTDYFFVTNQTRRSVKMLLNIARKLQSFGYYPDVSTEDVAEYIDSRIMLGTYQAKESEQWGLCHCIKNIDGHPAFSYGDFEKNKHCEIIKL